MYNLFVLLHAHNTQKLAKLIQVLCKTDWLHSQFAIKTHYSKEALPLEILPHSKCCVCCKANKDSYIAHHLNKNLDY